MSEFINTIDQLGEDVVFASIVDRSITEIKDDVLTTIGESAFQQCLFLTSVNFPNVTTIKNYAFEGCVKLQTINFPELIETAAQAFNSCSALTVVKYPKVKAIHSYLFSNCVNLTTVDFPSVTSIMASAFMNDTLLTTVILRSETMATLGNTNAFTNTPIANGTGYIYVPRSLLSDDDATKDYRRATNWATYSTQFRALEDFTVDGTITGELDWAKIEAAA